MSAARMRIYQQNSTYTTGAKSEHAAPTTRPSTHSTNTCVLDHAYDDLSLVTDTSASALSERRATRHRSPGGLAQIREFVARQRK